MNRRVVGATLVTSFPFAVLGPSAISSAATDHRSPAAVLSRGFTLYDIFVVMACFSVGFAAIGRGRFDSHWHIGAMVTFGCLATAGLCGEAWRLFRATRVTSLPTATVATYRLAVGRDVCLALILAAGCVSLLVPWSDGYPIQWGGNAWQADFDVVWWLAALATLGLPASRRPTDKIRTTRIPKTRAAFRLLVNTCAWPAAAVLLAAILFDATMLHWSLLQSVILSDTKALDTPGPQIDPASLDFIVAGATVFWLAVAGSLAALAMIVATRWGASRRDQARWRWMWCVAALLALTMVIVNVGVAMPRFAPFFVGHWDTPALAWLWGTVAMVLFAAIVAGRFESRAVAAAELLPLPPALRLAALHRQLWVAFLLAAGATGQSFAWDEPLGWQTIANACFPETMLQLAVILIVAERLIAFILRRSTPAVLSPISPGPLLRTWSAVLLATVLAIPSLALLGPMLWTLPWYVWQYFPAASEAARLGW
jgi:hypothetical protein